MGQLQTNEFRKFPDAYLRDIRMKTDRRYRFMVMSQRRTSSTVEKEQIAALREQELTPESVKEFLSNNPYFLDKFVNSHIAQDRVKAWITEPTADSLEKMETVQESRPSSSDTDIAVHPEGSALDGELRKSGSTGRRKSSIEFVSTSAHEKMTEEEMACQRSLSLLKKAEMGSTYDKKVMERKNQQIGLMVVNRETLLYPKKHKEEELKDLIERKFTVNDLVLDSHFFPFTQMSGNNLNHVFIQMIHKLVGKNAFPMHKLTYFLSTLRANYNDVEYHNYHHALSHAQSMYWILKNNPRVFSELEMKALMIASISHDAGHPGIDDYFMKKVNSGLQMLYDQPVLENHHTQVCFQILQDLKCNVFSDLSAEDYKIVLDDIKNSIISTNIDRYKLQAEKLRVLMESGTNLQIPTTRNSLKSLMMMVCDMCGNWKEWEEHKEIVLLSFKEFFAQGDLEAHLSIPSRPYKTRAAADTIHQAQISFMETVSLPVFRLLSGVFPSIHEIMNAAKSNVENWKAQHVK